MMENGGEYVFTNIDLSLKLIRLKICFRKVFRYYNVTQTVLIIVVLVY